MFNRSFRAVRKPRFEKQAAFPAPWLVVGRNGVSDVLVATLLLLLKLL